MTQTNIREHPTRYRFVGTIFKNKRLGRAGRSSWCSNIAHIDKLTCYKFDTSRYSINTYTYIYIYIWILPLHRLIVRQPGNDRAAVSAERTGAMQWCVWVVGAVLVFAGNVHWLVSVRPQVLQGQVDGSGWRRLGTIECQFPVRHQDVPQVHAFSVLCAGEAALPLGRLTTDNENGVFDNGKCTGSSDSGANDNDDEGDDGNAVFQHQFADDDKCIDCKSTRMARMLDSATCNSSQHHCLQMPLNGNA